jgi:hypothetical protein
VQLSAFADLDAATWDIAIDGRWLGAGPGERTVIALPPFDPTRLGSARLLIVWLSNGETYTLTALRPPNAKGQDKDLITVALPEQQAPLQVFDPLLSTEYTAEGTPRRFGIELWLGEDAEGDQHPLRLAGEAVGENPALREGSLTVHPMQSQGAGVSGLGLYLLVS